MEPPAYTRDSIPARKPLFTKCRHREGWRTTLWSGHAALLIFRSRLHSIRFCSPGTFLIGCSNQAREQTASKNEELAKFAAGNAAWRVQFRFAVRADWC